MQDDKPQDEATPNAEASRPHPTGLNRRARRKLGQIENAEVKALAKIPTSEFKPLDVSGLEYDEGVTPPVHDPTWPWMLEEVTQRLSDKKIIAHKMTGFSTKAVSGIRIQWAKPQDHFDFRRGKPLALEFKDAVTTMKLTHQSRQEKAPVVATNADDAIAALKEQESEK